MDDLKALIQRSKTGASLETQQNSKKFLTRKERERLEKQKAGENKKKSRKRPRNGVTEDRESQVEKDTENKVVLSLPKAEVVKRLRELGHPITLFGETDETRLARLVELEQTGSHFQLEGLALQGAHARNIADSSGTGDVIKQKKKKPVDSGIDMNRKAGDDSHEKKMSAEKHIYRFLKKMMYEWGEELDSRSEDEKRKAQGKLATRTYKQCKEYLKPFYKMLKSKSAEPDIVVHVNKIVTLCEQREYQTASDW
eukprot:CAMPEP_0184017098 /NCGR_PEP_ID=MMETSP0954-20121128/7321_1 /TAXON_ID=627963 /ORGANISM="Aplanochytrium sp, Strain PBS07" /LENGTH=253 /DNA_ID=CAMNT_0026298243 /DNA_START=32 /DNA_END=790 /DNA_ORIENTATION=+